MNRRSFMAATAATALGAAGCRQSSTATKQSGSFTHLLEGVGRENIKITGVKVTRLTYTAPKGEFVHEAGPVVLSSQDCAITQVFTDQGLVGIGPGPEGGRDRDFSSLTGRNPFDVELLGLNGGIDVACWDIIGKAKGVPVYRLLATDNQPNPRVHVYASGGVNWTFYDRGDGKPYGADALIEEALRYKEMGFDTFKWRPGTDWEEAGITAGKLGETVCRKLREAVGPDFKLGLEKKAWDAWTFEQAMEIAPIINDLKFYFFEQPLMDLGPAQFDDYLKLKAAMPNVMLWGGEGFRNLEFARPFIEKRIYDAVQSDSIRFGITENWRLARVAAFHDVKMVPHNWITALGTMCNTHLVAGVPNGFMCEYFLYPNTAWRDALFTEPPAPKNGYITLNDKPGFGMELVNLDELAKKYPYTPDLPRLMANPRFPKAWDRARAREEQVRAKYQPQGPGRRG
ncbi:MAG: mandelate racemase/muconate lactonizing enzyme family protein [Bryobacterales bacterium]|nr:mandelate racemase/muconate lactonizing enzyme family protein [Bryobacterales bacterium]